MTVLVTGAGGFIGGHLAGALLDRGDQVRGVDIKRTADWYQIHAGSDWWTRIDLRDLRDCHAAVRGCDTVYHLAADMGGMGFIESHKADCALNVLIDANMLLAARDARVQRFVFASTACVYRADRQDTATPVPLREDRDVYPAQPEDGYGWAKLYGEHLARHFTEDYGMATSILRYHSVYGPHGTWEGGREKVPAALCRKVAQAIRSGDSHIEVWGDGEQARSFLYIDDAVDATLAAAGQPGPLNIGSSDLVTVNELAATIMMLAGVDLEIRHVPGPVGVRGRSSDNTRIGQVLGWKPAISLAGGLTRTYDWIAAQLADRGDP